MDASSTVDAARALYDENRLVEFIDMAKRLLQHPSTDRFDKINLYILLANCVGDYDESRDYIIDASREVDLAVYNDEDATPEIIKRWRIEISLIRQAVVEHDADRIEVESEDEPEDHSGGGKPATLATGCDSALELRPRDIGLSKTGRDSVLE